MATTHQCPDCGAEVGPDSPDGACLKCAFSGALLPTTEAVPTADAMADATLAAEVRVHYFGDYRLLSEIGRGGMGVVYRAQQVSLNRIVALKMILAGRLASEADVRRFQHEAECAANLQHPNIVAIHEIGQHEGQHYYSMELVQGQNLDQRVRQQPLSAHEAACLLKTIAEAIHFAHEKGTVHRDLKPTNILIDQFGQPRITDFGLARRTDTDRHLTAPGQILGTPAFMSPEQAAGKSDAVGPAADVYSAGAILYYLLTQKPPFTADSLPSLLALVSGPESPVSPRALNPGVPCDLETICLKCLEKDPSRRYASARSLAEDLGRFCRNEPILARPPSRAGRAWRWCARNRALAAALAVAALTLAAGAGVSTWQAVRATKEAATSRQTTLFLREMLQGVGPSVALGRDTAMLKEILDQTAERIGQELKGQPVVEAELRGTIGEVYLQLAEYGKAEVMLREALRLARAVHGQEHAEVAGAMDNVSIVLFRQAKLAEAEGLAREALAMRTRLLGQNHPEVAKSLINLAVFLQTRGKLAEAETVSRQALALNRKLHGNNHQLVATALNNLGCVLCLEGKLVEAEGIFSEVLAIQRKLLGNGHPDVATALNNLARIYADQSKTREAESLYRETLALRRKLLGGEHPDVAQTLDSLASTLQDQGSMAEAETLYRDALAIRKKSLGTEHPDVALSLNNLADLLDDEDKHADAEAMQREALAMQRKLLGNDHPDVARSLCNLARMLRQQGKADDVGPLLQEALATQRKLLGDDHPDVAISLEELAEVHSAGGRHEAAEALLRESLNLREKRLPDDWLTFSTRSALGETLLAQGQHAAAEPLLLSGCHGLRQRETAISAANKPRLQRAVQRLIRLYEVTGRPDQAAEWKLKLAEFNGPTPAPASGPRTQSQ